MTSGVTDVACIGLDVAGGGCAADGGEAYAVVHWFGWMDMCRSMVGQAAGGSDFMVSCVW